VTAINSATFWDMTKCNAIELPTFRGNVPPSSRANNPECEALVCVYQSVL
jgi:hypothetical protein